jgi:hypothetical protein
MLDKYALFAITCSLTTLDQPIDLVEVENTISQQEYDKGVGYIRKLVSGLDIRNMDLLYLIATDQLTPCPQCTV